MNRRAVCRLLLGTAFALTAGGCSALRETELPIGHPLTRFDDRSSATPLKLPVAQPGRVVHVTATSTSTSTGAAAPAPLPLGTPPSGPTMPTAPAALLWEAPNADPHRSTNPLSTRGNATPKEAPMERDSAMVRRIDGVNEENKVLQARIRNVEIKLAERDRAVAESNEENDASAADAAKTLAELATMRKEIQTLEQRLHRVEKDETETLRLLVEATEKLLDVPGEGKK